MILKNESNSLCLKIIHNIIFFKIFFYTLGDNRCIQSGLLDNQNNCLLSVAESRDPLCVFLRHMPGIGSRDLLNLYSPKLLHQFICLLIITLIYIFFYASYLCILTLLIRIVCNACLVSSPPSNERHNSFFFKCNMINDVACISAGISEKRGKA